MGVAAGLLLRAALVLGVGAIAYFPLATASTATPSPTIASLKARLLPGNVPAPVAEKAPAFSRLTGAAVPPAPAPREEATKKPLFAKKKKTTPPEPEPEPEAPRKKKQRAIYAALSLFAAALVAAIVKEHAFAKTPAKDEAARPRVLRLDSPEPARVAPATPPPKAPETPAPPTPAELKASRKELLARVKVVLEKDGCDIDKARKAGKNMVFAAAECGNVEALSMLLAAGADPNAPAQKSGETPASVAGRKGHKAAKDFLLSKGGVVKRGKSSLF